MTSPFKRLMVGKPIATSEESHQRLGKPTALAVFASDAISSTAYATEEMLLVLLMAVTFPQATNYLVPISVAAVILLAIVSISYIQTVRAYPDGGGAYVVSRENISRTAALVAGASLLVDYTLVVAVSISAGVLAIGSAFDFNDNAPLRVGLAVFFVAMMCFGNLRGVKESGKVFAVPTYFYVTMLALFLIGGFYKLFTGDLGELNDSAELAKHFEENHDLAATATLVRAAAGLQLRCRRAVRRGGHLERRAGVQEARVAQRLEGPDHDVEHPGGGLPRHLDPGPPPQAGGR